MLEVLGRSLDTGEAYGMYSEVLRELVKGFELVGDSINTSCPP